MQMERNTAVQSAGAQNWMIRVWNSASVPNATEIMSIVRITCLRMNIESKF